jgi:endonuclease YncB( thermonuclease family)
MQRKLSLGGIFLLFLLFCAILSCIQPDTISSTEDTTTTEDTISFTEDTISTEDTFPYTENTISIEDTTPPEDTNTWEEDTLLCTAVIDGDTFKLETGETVRLIGIDAPELSQPGGDKSRQFLAQLILNKGVTLESGYEDRDKYDRLLRFVYIDDVCINEEMIRQGYAEARYLTDSIREHYIQLEMEAETAKAGLWSDNIFQPRLNLGWEEDIPVIDWKDAENSFNQYVIVEGIIVDTYNSGAVCFLNFDTNQFFTAVIFASDFPGFPVSPESFYLGKTVQIIGIIKEYRRSPEIIVKTPQQIRIISQNQHIFWSLL